MKLEALEKLTNHVAIMARGRIAAVGTLQQIRELLDDYPTSVRIALANPRHAARLLLNLADVLAVEVEGEESVVVKARHPKRFFAEFGRLVVAERLEVSSLEPLDESAHAILGYLLGGSGKT